MTQGAPTASRESQESTRRERPEKPVAYIDQTRCDRAPGCPVSRVCPKDALVSEAAESGPPTPTRSLFGSRSARPRPAWKVDESKCTGCLLCARYCPHQAVQARSRQSS
jgi:NAD-dependent dihydropyrimidine dehydrogenase PreA subunit